MCLRTLVRWCEFARSTCVAANYFRLQVDPRLELHAADISRVEVSDVQQQEA